MLNNRNSKLYKAKHSTGSALPSMHDHLADIKLESDSAEATYLDYIDWQRAIQPGGKFYQRFELLRSFDFERMDWPTGQGPGEQPDTSTEGVDSGT
jgi:hypothetical protein